MIGDVVNMPPNYLCVQAKIEFYKELCIPETKTMGSFKWASQTKADY